MATGLGISEALLDYVDQRYGSEAVERLHHWQALTYPSSEGGDIDKLERVNRFFNRMQFIDDQQHWGRRDYWATPVEMIVSNGGDCEDFSIAKYFTLLEMGIPERRLRITYVKATTLNQGHMVLAYYQDAGSVPLILDNLVDTIQPADQRADLEPIYSFNGSGLWQSVERGLGRRVGNAARVSLWTDLVRRMQDEAAGRI